MTTSARELIALRTHLATHLHPEDAAALAWPTIASLAGPGLDLGWGGAGLAAAAMLGVYSGGVDNPAAYVAANIRDLASGPPPRETTSQPPDVRHVLADMHARNLPASDAATWARRIREQAAERRHA